MTITVSEIERTALDGHPDSERIELAHFSGKANTLADEIRALRQRSRIKTAEAIVAFLSVDKFRSYLGECGEEAQLLLYEMVLSMSGTGRKRSLASYGMMMRETVSLGRDDSPLAVSRPNGLIVHLRSSAKSIETLCGEQLPPGYRQASARVFSTDRPVGCVRCRAHGDAVQVIEAMSSEQSRFGQRCEQAAEQLITELAAAVAAIDGPVDLSLLAPIRSAAHRRTVAAILACAAEDLLQLPACERLAAVYGFRSFNQIGRPTGDFGSQLADAVTASYGAEPDWPKARVIVKALIDRVAAGEKEGRSKDNPLNAQHYLSCLTVTCFPDTRPTLEALAASSSEAWAAALREELQR